MPIQPSTPPAFTAVLFGLAGCLVDFGARSQTLAPPRTPPAEHAEATPGALEHLGHLHAQGVPCAWLSELPDDANQCLAAPLPAWLAPGQRQRPRPWPAPDACWQALAGLGVETLDGCVLVSGEPRLLQAGLNAGLWTIGLAVCGSLCGQGSADWQALDTPTRDRLRAQATLALYRLGVHSVIDHLDDLAPGLADLAARRLAGEKP